jgi:hypothetical protein
MTRSTPPDFAIRAAVEAGKRSPCAKSKRGAAVFNPEDPDPFVFGVGWNAQPEPFACTGSEACRASCGKLCVHAEARAIRGLGSAIALARRLELVHAKVVDGGLVGGGGPSCWQCSREVLDVGLAGVWLYEDVGAICDARDEAGTICSSAEHTHAGDVTCASWRTTGAHPNGGEWRRYTAEVFHRATLQACGIGAP